MAVAFLAPYFLSGYSFEYVIRARFALQMVANTELDAAVAAANRALVGTMLPATVAAVIVTSPRRSRVHSSGSGGASEDSETEMSGLRYASSGSLQSSPRQLNRVTWAHRCVSNQGEVVPACGDPLPAHACKNPTVEAALVAMNVGQVSSFRVGASMSPEHIGAEQHAAELLQGIDDETSVVCGQDVGQHSQLMADHGVALPSLGSELFDGLMVDQPGSGSDEGRVLVATAVTSQRLLPPPHAKPSRPLRGLAPQRAVVHSSDATVVFISLLGVLDTMAVDASASVAKVNAYLVAMEELLVRMPSVLLVKHIGDMSLAVVGLPQYVVGHANVAMSFVRALRRVTAAQGACCTVGVNSGPIIGVVLGMTQLCYDVFR